jgi:orotidine-5'-phosphate decarboxylase
VSAEPALATSLFADRLAEAVERKRSQLVVGLDPRPDLLPVELVGDPQYDRAGAAEGCARFCRGIIDSVAPHVVAVKPQLAFFEALGSDGFSAFEEVCAYARAAGLLVIADANAAAYLEPVGEQRPSLADAMTVNAYLGRDSLEPFVTACRRHGGGLFCLVKTSNEGGADVQDLVLSDGRRLWQHLALIVNELGEELVGNRGLSSIGAVVGATHPRAVGEARRLMPKAVLLLPGVGAQGATPADLARAFTSGPASALVTASRSVLYAFRSNGEDWRTAAALEAARLRRDVWAVSGW